MMGENGDHVVIVIFGASGDLTQRKLIPALHSMACEGLLPHKTQIVGVARSKMTNQEFRDRLYSGVEAYARFKPDICTQWSSFSGRHTYISGGYDDAQTYRRLQQHLDAIDTAIGEPAHRLFYLATPPFLYPVVVAQLGNAGLNHHESGWTRIIIEKPFGHDLDSARALNHQVHAVFEESQVYRIDHYLGKETVQNIITFRFANAIFEPLWNRNFIDHVQITVSEDVLVGSRAGYYDGFGVLRDMFQNHLLQLLTLVAMEPPSAFNARALRDEKVKVLQAIRSPESANIVLGQYAGYLQEDGVVEGSKTPTYAALRVFVDNWRWQGVPFYIRSGKGLSQKVSEITLAFKEVPHLLFPQKAALSPNHLSLCIQPNEGVHLNFATKQPGAGMQTSPVDMEFYYASRFGDMALPEAYERLLLDAIQGDAALFTRGDEIELAWQFIDQVIAGSPEETQPYPVGSWGPEAAEEMLASLDCAWHYGCKID
ncbi:MAG: glucose-6-phosphate dehydrogenase [Anaerolineae bacterium]|nr:glucose-6-phosphate dehydrogenase [Anaerolineae bacterium]